jgi:hypothetical protein
VLALKRTIFGTSYVGDASAMRREWENPDAVCWHDPKAADPKYVRIVLERDRQYVHAVEMLGPLALMRPTLAGALDRAWERWGSIAAGWEIGGYFDDPVMAGIVQRFDPVIKLARPREHAIPGLPGHPTELKTKLYVPTFREMYEARLRWAS